MSPPQLSARTLLCLLALLCSFSGGEVWAQQDSVPQDVKQVRNSRDWVPHVRLHFGAPQRASIAVGGMRVLSRAGDYSWDRGPLIVVEPGIAAGKIRIGFGQSGAFGFSVEAAALKAWGKTDWAEPRRDYLGGEFHLSLMFIDVGIGAYQTIGSTKHRRFAWSVGLGV